MKAKKNPVLIVVHCKDCGEYVGTLMVEAGKRPSKLTNRDQKRLAYTALADAIQDGTLPEEHSLEADIILPPDGASLAEVQHVADQLHLELARQHLNEGLSGSQTHLIN